MNKDGKILEECKEGQKMDWGCLLMANSHHCDQQRD